MAGKILVIGSINLDSTVVLDRVPNKGETLLANSIGEFPGGKGANQALAVAKLGGEVMFAGKTGPDQAGTTLTENLKANGVDTDCLTISQSSDTGRALIFVEADGDNRIVVLSGANAEVGPGDVDRCFDGDAEYSALLMQLEIPLPTVAYAIKAAQSRNIPVVIDAGPAVTKDLDLFHGVDILSPNQHEMEELIGLPAGTVEEGLVAARALREKTAAKNIVLKMGDLGALVLNEIGHKFVPSFSVKAVDTTAAGDAFTAALTIGFTNGWDWEETLRYANAVGALTVSKLGAYTSLPSKEEVEDFLAQQESQ